MTILNCSVARPGSRSLDDVAPTGTAPPPSSGRLVQAVAGALVARVEAQRLAEVRPALAKSLRSKAALPRRQPTARGQLVVERVTQRALEANLPGRRSIGLAQRLHGRLQRVGLVLLLAVLEGASGTGG